MIWFLLQGVSHVADFGKVGMVGAIPIAIGIGIGEKKLGECGS